MTSAIIMRRSFLPEGRSLQDMPRLSCDLSTQRTLRLLLALRRQVCLQAWPSQG